MPTADQTARWKWTPRWTPERLDQAQQRMRSTTARERKGRPGLVIHAPPKVQRIMREAEQDHGIDPHDILSPRQFRPFAHARCQAAQEMHYQLGLTHVTIARYLGGMNHTSIWKMLQKPRWKQRIPAAPANVEGFEWDEWV